MTREAPFHVEDGPRGPSRPAAAGGDTERMGTG